MVDVVDAIGVGVSEGMQQAEKDVVTSQMIAGFNGMILLRFCAEGESQLGRSCT